MNTYLNEDEQVEALKQWWKKYGTFSIIAVIIGIASVSLYQYWQNQRIAAQGQASTIYQKILSEVELGDKNRQSKQANYIKHHYPHSVYASMASLFLAKLALNENDLKAVNKELSSAADRAGSVTLRHLINIRRARVLTELGEYTQALNLLDTINDSAFASAVANVQGDIYLQQGQSTAAKAAYQTALKENSGISQLDELIHLKLINIVETVS